jgi:heat shock protein HslJ
VVWRLAALDGAPFAARATLRFDGAGRIDGQAPCNRYSAAQPLALPGFAAGPVAATRMACPDLAAEGAYFAALEAMTRAEIGDEALVLSNAAGRSMTFRRAD